MPVDPEDLVRPISDLELRRCDHDVDSTRCGVVDSRQVGVARQIVGLGGGGDTVEQTNRLYDYVLELTGTERPRLLYVPTAVAESNSGIVSFYERVRRSRRALASQDVPVAT